MTASDRAAVRRQALSDELLSQMKAAWDTKGSGTYKASTGYVQWAKYEPGLQIECVSNAFLPSADRLTFLQRRQLAELGFSSPEPPSWPNYFRRFNDFTELSVAANVLASVVVDVLGDTEAQETDERPCPSQAQVAVVVPVGKCDPAVVWKILNGTAPHITIRQPCTFINAYQRHVRLNLDDSHRTSRVTRNLAEWVALPDDSGPPDVLTTQAPDTLDQQLAWAAHLARAVRWLRQSDRDTLIIGPYYLPHGWLYNGLVRELCDTVIAIGTDKDLQLCERQLTDLLRPPIGRTVLTYGPSHPVLPWDVHHRHLDVDEDQLFVAELIVAVRAQWLTEYLPRL